MLCGLTIALVMYLTPLYFLTLVRRVPTWTEAWA